MLISADAHKAQAVKLQQLAALHPWPEIVPATDGATQVLQLSAADRAILAGSIPRTTGIILVIGAGNPALIQHLCDLALTAAVIVLGTPDNIVEDAALTRQLRYYTRQVIPISMDAVAGVQYVHDAEITPDIVYHNTDAATGGFVSLYARLLASAKVFPSAINMGHEWNDPGTSKAVGVVAERMGRECTLFDASIWALREHGWLVKPNRTRRGHRK